MSHGSIELRGVCVHNLKHVDLDLPRGKLIVFCGASGSGKSSLALDTLYAEGQRRYIESFSAHTRQFLEKLEKPAAERIEGIPPAIAVTRSGHARSSRATVGTATETAEYLRLLFAKVGQMRCAKCDRAVRRDSPESIGTAIAQVPAGTRAMIAAPLVADGLIDTPARVAELRENGFVRVIAAGTIVALDDANASASLASAAVDDAGGDVLVVVDRITAAAEMEPRWNDSIETALAEGRGRCAVLFDGGELLEHAREMTIDGRTWRRLDFSNRLECIACGIEYPPLEPKRLSFDSPLGACPKCEGFGDILDIDMDLVVPDPSKSIRDGAIAPWNTKAYRHELEELLALAADYKLDVDVPFHALDERQRAIVRDGVPERNFGGLRGFFAWLERRKYKVHLRAYLSRWRSSSVCPECGGKRLRPEALAVRVGKRNLAEVSALKIRDALAFFRALSFGEHERRIARTMLEQVVARLGFLDTVGLGYLTLDRSMSTLSGGEAQRVTLTTALGSSLVNMLYVLDEPSVGLHPADVERLVAVVRSLAERRNTVVVVEHEEAMLRAADLLVELGPGAGERGGQIVFRGTPAEIVADANSVTGQYLSGMRGGRTSTNRRPTNRGAIKLVGARGHNLKDLTVDFPLGVLCVVTGVSGAGKSTLVEDTLYPAVCKRLRKPAPKAAEYEDVYGAHQVDDVMLVDQSPIGRSPRSNPVTYLKAFDEIRKVFAETVEARTHNFDAGYFSFNVDGGRCSVCRGDGYLEVDMQFLADVYMKCPQCRGQRYRPEILKVKYRGRNIAEVLDMTVREAFTFFRGQKKVQQRLRRLIDVGLDYVRLGQGANTLSGGESQRLKLAAHLTTIKRGRSLFILDEPTTGLHFADVAQLLDCFDALLDIGHSLVVVEHNLQVIRAADYVIDLGPGAADEGGEVVATGTPEEIAGNERSATGRWLARKD
ncbi:MAG: excinuclease ABC subunit A [Planctomycetota bacterium]|nr:MAG: excinuclease ABC subunit A [Planctomycetota bacterium]